MSENNDNEMMQEALPSASDSQDQAATDVPPIAQGESSDSPSNTVARSEETPPITATPQQSHLTNNSAQEGHSQRRMPSPFPVSISIFGALIFMFVLIALWLPEYYEYQIRERQLDLWQEQIRKGPTKKLESSSNMQTAPQQTPAVTATVTSPQASPTNSTITVSTPSTIQAISPTPTPSLVTIAPNVDPSNLFESYGRFLTLLVGLVSVLGFFLGFFIKKSIQETEEHVEKRLTRNMKWWEKEQNEIRQTYDMQKKNLDIRLAEVETLEQKVKELEARFDKDLGELEKTLKRDEEGPQKREPDINEAANTLDSQLSDSEMPNE